MKKCFIILTGCAVIIVSMNEDVPSIYRGVIAACAGISLRLLMDKVFDEKK